jgi:demethoxyubiquinone hydroxylase (CLK1/Coq7/Cat5 family)
MDSAEARQRLIAALQGAYSGELAAARAYNGHWRSLSDPDERAHIRRVEEEELHHRELVGRMLADLGAGPRAWRELFFGTLGRILSALCFVSGYFAAMHGAGRLEEKNVAEYADAARYAALAGLGHLCDDLLAMSEVEHDHQRYFRARTEAHWLSGLVPMWPTLPARSEIRAAFAREFPEVPIGRESPGPG